MIDHVYRSESSIFTWTYLAQILVLALFYFAAGQASFTIAVSSGIVAPVVFAAEGFALAATILLGPRVWPGVFLGQFVLAASNGLAWELSLAIATSNSLEAALGVYLFRYFKLHPALDRMRDLTGLLALIILILQPFSATFGNFILWTGNIVQTAELANSWFFWWLSNVLGQILVVPMLLSLYCKQQAGQLKPGEILLAVLPMLFTGWLMFHLSQSSGMAIAFAATTPLLVLMAVKLGMAAVTVATFTVGAMVLYYTHLGTGPFVSAGTTLALDLNIFLLGTALTGQFIAALFAERKAAELALRESEAKFHTLYDSTSDAVMLLNERGFIDCNQAALTLFGCATREQFCALHPIDLSPPQQACGTDSMALAQQHIATAMQGNGHHFEWIHQRADTAETFPADVLLSAMTLNGEPILQATVRDISERKRIDKMKSEFVSTVSHELRTPLTSISGALGLLVGGVVGEMPDKAKQMLDIAYRNCLRLAHLIDDLLDMEKLVAGKMRFDLVKQPLMPLVENTLESMRAYGEQYQVRFVLTQRADDVQVNVDSTRLQQVLSNFLSNAAKFSHQGGQVEVIVKPGKHRVRVEVIDHGSGIPAEFRSRIFQKFSQADSSDTRQKGGTGLGLAISMEIIEHMNGRVGFESEEGQGACFNFELPTIEASNAENRCINSTTHSLFD